MFHDEFQVHVTLLFNLDAMLVLYVSNPANRTSIGMCERAGIQNMWQDWRERKVRKSSTREETWNCMEGWCQKKGVGRCAQVGCIVQKRSY